MNLHQGLRVSMLLGAISLLTACYFSEKSLIPEGEAVLPVDHGLTLCPDGPNNCVEMSIEGDTYLTAPEAGPDQTGAARFYPLVQVDGRQIYLLEAHDTEDDAFSYLVARRTMAEDDGPADMELALVTCEALSEDELTDFLAAGGQVSSGWGRECRAPDLQTLTSTFRTAYLDEFADNAWWAEGGAD